MTSFGNLRAVSNKSLMSAVSNCFIQSALKFLTGCSQGTHITFRSAGLLEMGIIRMLLVLIPVLLIDRSAITAGEDL